MLLAPGGIAAAGAEAEVGAPSGRGPSDRAQAMDHAKAELVVARAELALARDALTAAEQAAAVAADPLPLQATIERSRAEVATLVGIVRSWQAALQSAIADVTSTPARGADGASGSGLHASGRAPKRALQTESDEEDGIDEEGASTAKGKRPAKLSDLPRTIQTPTLGFLDAEGKVHRNHAVLGSLLVVVATVVMEVAAVGAMPLGPMPHLWVAGAGAEAVVAVVVAQARHATAAEGWGISRQIAPTST